MNTRPRRRNADTTQTETTYKQVNKWNQEASGRSARRKAASERPCAPYLATSNGYRGQPASSAGCLCSTWRLCPVSPPRPPLAGSRSVVALPGGCKIGKITTTDNSLGPREVPTQCATFAYLLVGPCLGGRAVCVVFLEQLQSLYNTGSQDALRVGVRQRGTVKLRHRTLPKTAHPSTGRSSMCAAEMGMARRDAETMSGRVRAGEVTARDRWERA